MESPGVFRPRATPRTAQDGARGTWYSEDMIRTLIFAVVLGAAAPVAFAENAPSNAASTAALADRLVSIEKMAPREALAKLKARGESGDAPSRKLAAALQDNKQAREMEVRLFEADTTGALTERFKVLAKALEAARRGDAALAIIDEKSLGPLPGAPKGPGVEKDGWEHRTEIFAGASGTADGRLPATGLSQESEFTHGPWKVELGARALFAPTGKLLPSDGTLEAKGSRKIGDSPFRLYAGAELHRDDLMGLERHVSVHGGVAADIVDTERQQLSASFAGGAATEKHLGGGTERHPLTLTTVEYALNVSAKAVFHQEFELESNPRVRKDYEFKSVTSMVYDLTENLAVRIAHQFVKRGEPVEGYAGRRSETTIGVVIH